MYEVDLNWKLPESAVMKALSGMEVYKAVRIIFFDIHFLVEFTLEDEDMVVHERMFVHRFDDVLNLYNTCPITIRNFKIFLFPPWQDHMEPALKRVSKVFNSKKNENFHYECSDGTVYRSLFGTEDDSPEGAPIFSDKELNHL